MIDWDSIVIGPLTQVFGEPITFSPVVSQPASGTLLINGVFDEAYTELDIAGGTAITTQAPVVGIQVSQFGMLPMQGDLLTINRTGETFIVKEVRIDGHGAGKLLLNFAP